MSRKKPRILSAGVIIVRYFEPGWRYFLLRVYNYWAFPKGEVELGEDPLTAAVRLEKRTKALRDPTKNHRRACQETED